MHPSWALLYSRSATCSLITRRCVRFASSLAVSVSSGFTTFDASDVRLPGGRTGSCELGYGYLQFVTMSGTNLPLRSVVDRLAGDVMLLLEEFRERWSDVRIADRTSWHDRADVEREVGREARSACGGHERVTDLELRHRLQWRAAALARSPPLRTSLASVS